MNKQTALSLHCSCCSIAFLSTEVLPTKKTVASLFIKYVISLGLNTVMHGWKMLFLPVAVLACLIEYSFHHGCYFTGIFAGQMTYASQFERVFFLTWHSLLWITSQKLAVHSDLILQGWGLYIINCVVFWLRIKLNGFSTSLWVFDQQFVSYFEVKVLWSTFSIFVKIVPYA